LLEIEKPMPPGFKSKLFVATKKQGILVERFELIKLEFECLKFLFQKRVFAKLVA